MDRKEQGRENTHITHRDGDLVHYDFKSENEVKPPGFMLWHEISEDGKPKLDLHKHRWSSKDMAIVLEVKMHQKNCFLKLLKNDGGIGWTLAAWCKNERSDPYSGATPG